MTDAEERRFDEADDLKKCLAFHAITAFRIRVLFLLARERLGDPAIRHVIREDMTGSAPSRSVMASRLAGGRRT